jgi:hypothetical protein
MESNGTGSAYRFVASDGGVFTYGDGFFGSAVAPPVSSPPPASPAGCTVTMSNQQPPAGGDETATVQSSDANVGVSVTADYKTKTSTYPGTTDANGTAAITFNIGNPTAGYTVNVTATVAGSTCSTSFTPQ